MACVDESGTLQLELLEEMKESSTVVITGQQSYKVQEILSTISEMLGYKKPVEFLDVEQSGHYVTTPFKHENEYPRKFIPDFHIDWFERGWIKDQGSLINPLLTPGYLRIQMLPEPMKDRLREKYNTAQEWMDANTKNKDKRYDSLIKFLDEADYSHKIKEWFKTTEKLDKLRNENWREVFPELADLEKYVQ